MLSLTQVGLQGLLRPLAFEREKVLKHVNMPTTWERKGKIMLTSRNQKNNFGYMTIKREVKLSLIIKPKNSFW